jgi:Kef-type K+ transport system membrane component KefB
MPSSRRYLVYYLVLATLLAAAFVAVFAAGAGQDPERSVAGGYDVAAGADCLGPRVDVRQSGQFGGIAAPEGGVGGSIRIRDRHVTGTLTCRDGKQAAVDATIEGGRLRGELAGAPVEATFRREPPDPGAQKPRPPSDVAGEYNLTPRSDCLGGRMVLEAEGDGLALRSRAAAGEARYRAGVLSGLVECGEETTKISGQASNREIALTLESTGERVTATRRREFGGTLATFFLAVAIVMLLARLAGQLVARLGQPRVMGEVAAGIVLGPTVLGALAPDLQAAIFPSDVIPFIGVAANLGLIFYMFLVGLEIDFSQLRGRVAQTAAISNTGVAVPMIAGLAIALPLYPLLGTEKEFVAFGLFMGVSMSITAFPVLARILVERRMLKQPIGVLAIASAAIDDVTAWFLIALATAVAVAGSALDVLETVLMAVAFCLVMGFGVRRLLARASVAYDEAGRVPTAWITAIFAGILLAAYTTEEIGIALIFGAFVMGAIMPRHAGLTEDVTHRLEDFVVLLLLPLFFAFTGLRTNIGLLDNASLLLITLGVLLVAIACKFGGTLVAARFTGLGWRDSAVLGALMNTRGLTELIVLNLALEKGVISEALFAALVIMALVTTFMTGPILRRVDPRNELGEPLEVELEAARRETADIAPMPVPDRSILLAPQTDAALAQLLALAEPLARSQPPRELIVVEMVRPPRGAEVRGALQTQQLALEQAQARVLGVRSDLLSRGVAARAVAFTSTDTGRDLVRLGTTEDVDLVLVDGRRPLLGEGVPTGPVATLLEQAPGDVAVLVAREDARIELGPETPLVVPFGGAEHDWAALELGAWLAAGSDTPLRLLGASGQTDEQRDPQRDPQRLLANASLLVQRFIGVPAEAVTAEPGHEAILAAASGAGLLVVGLSDRWRSEGLGATRAELARAAPAPILFVRRGTRAGALAPRGDVTRFTWSIG